MLSMPTLSTARLTVRDLSMDDLDAVHRILDHELALPEEPGLTRQQRQQWLRWTCLNTQQLAALYQPPYGERGVFLHHDLIGACGLVPLLAPFGQVGLDYGEASPGGGFHAEVGLYYALSPAHRGMGLATEAAQALIDYAFSQLGLSRILACTTTDNTASQGVMRRLGMALVTNPLSTPAWLQCVGVLHNPTLATAPL